MDSEYANCNQISKAKENVKISANQKGNSSEIKEAQSQESCEIQTKTQKMSLTNKFDNSLANVKLTESSSTHENIQPPDYDQMSSLPHWGELNVYHALFDLACLVLVLRDMSATKEMDFALNNAASSDTLNNATISDTSAIKSTSQHKNENVSDCDCKICDIDYIFSSCDLLIKEIKRTIDKYNIHV